MSKEAIFTLTVQQELRDEFVAAAEASHQSPSQILLDMMEDFVRQQQQAPDYLAFLQKKADIARSELADGEAVSDEDVERQFAARRAAAAAKMR